MILMARFKGEKKELIQDETVLLNRLCPNGLTKAMTKPLN